MKLKFMSDTLQVNEVLAGRADRVIRLLERTFLDYTFVNPVSVQHLKTIKYNQKMHYLLKTQTCLVTRYCFWTFLRVVSISLIFKSVMYIVNFMCYNILP